MRAAIAAVSVLAVVSSWAERPRNSVIALPMPSGVVAAMLSINPALRPERLRILLRRSAMAIGPDPDLEAPDADDLTAPILPSERNQQLDHPDVGRSARLDMYQALDLAAQSLQRVR